MAKFAEYGFNKSHSAAYALIAYQTAYLKAHYPVEFMAALLTEDMENTDKVDQEHQRDAANMGIDMLPPDINASRPRFHRASAATSASASARSRGSATRRHRGDHGGAPRRAVPLPAGFLRTGRPAQGQQRVIEALIKCGAFDSLGGKRAQ